MWSRGPDVANGLGSLVVDGGDVLDHGNIENDAPTHTSNKPFLPIRCYTTVLPARRIVWSLGISAEGAYSAQSVRFITVAHDTSGAVDLRFACRPVFDYLSRFAHFRVLEIAEIVGVFRGLTDGLGDETRLWGSR